MQCELGDFFVPSILGKQNSKGLTVFRHLRCLNKLNCLRWQGEHKRTHVPTPEIASVNKKLRSVVIVDVLCELWFFLLLKKQTGISVRNRISQTEGIQYKLPYVKVSTLLNTQWFQKTVPRSNCETLSKKPPPLQERSLWSPYDCFRIDGILPPIVFALLSKDHPNVVPRPRWNDPPKNDQRMKDLEKAPCRKRRVHLPTINFQQILC